MQPSIELYLQVRGNIKQRAPMRAVYSAAPVGGAARASRASCSSLSTSAYCVLATAFEAPVVTVLPHPLHRGGAHRSRVCAARQQQAHGRHVAARGSFLERALMSIRPPLRGRPRRRRRRAAAAPRQAGRRYGEHRRRGCRDQRRSTAEATSKPVPCTLAPARSSAATVASSPVSTA